MKILIVSDVPWSDDNSVGNTYSNIFGSMENVEFANLYCKPGIPNSKILKKYYQVSEKDIIKKFIKKKDAYMSSNYIQEFKKEELTLNEQKFYDFLRISRLSLLFVIREMIWKFGDWKTKELNCFIHEFSPDIIFSFCLDSVYYSRIIEYCRLNSFSNLVLFFADDVYAYKSWSPLLLLHQFFVRKSIKKLVSSSKLIYGATNELCDEYSNILNRDIIPLFKICTEVAEVKNASKKPLIMTYTGNLFYGRWKVLSLLSDAIEEINHESTRIILDIYSSGLRSGKMTRHLNRDKISYLRSAIPYDEVKNVLKESDIVVHVESFERKEIKKTRLSFSTKIVDCFQSGSFLFAIGPEEVASIDFLKKMDIAKVITKFSKREVKQALEKILDNENVLFETSVKMNEYGRKYHTKEYLKKNLYNKLDELIKR